MELLLVMVLAHLAADFLLQNPQIVADKIRELPRGYLLHFTGHLLALVTLTHPYFSPALAVLWIALPAAHLLVDWLKNRLFPPSHPAGALIFLLDQALHLTMLFLAWRWVNPSPCPAVLSFYRRFFTPAGLALLGKLCPGGAAAALFTAAVYAAVIFGGAVLVRKILDGETLRLPGPADELDESRRAGRCIGMLERAVILSLARAGAFTSIAFVLTAKSIARYKELEKREFAEYYLVGTLLSTLLAILGGLLLKFIL